MSFTVKERGCGTREENGLYACVPTSPFGKPVDYFLQDPAIPIEISEGESMRAPLFRKDPNDVYHLIMGVGTTYYPFISDYIEETRVMGISKRLPQNFDYRKLDPNKSSLMLIHSRAIPLFSYHIKQEDYHRCPRLLSGKYAGDKDNPVFKDDLVTVRDPVLKRDVQMVKHQCLGDNYALSSMLHVEDKHELEDHGDETFRVNTPSTTYKVNAVYTMRDGQRMTWVDDTQYQWGIFLQFPKFHFEFVREKPKQIGDVVKDKDGNNYTLETQEMLDNYNGAYETSLQKVQEVYLDKGFGFRVMEG